LLFFCVQIVNFYNIEDFCFWFIFHHSTTMLAIMHAMMLLQWIEIFGICLLEFCSVLEFIKFIVLCLLDLGGMFWFRYSRLLHLLYVYSVTYVAGAKYSCKWKVFKAGFHEFKY
jgi:hypothetical protein